MSIKSIANSILFNYSYEVILNDLSLEWVPPKEQAAKIQPAKAKA